MKKFEKVTKPEVFDFYTIEKNEQGVKEVKLLGYTYKGDNWKVIDMTADVISLSEFVGRMKEDIVEELYMSSKQYEDDVTDEQAVDAINGYFGGNPADYMLRFEEIGMDTPCGNYVHKG